MSLAAGAKVALWGVVAVGLGFIAYKLVEGPPMANPRRGIRSYTSREPRRLSTPSAKRSLIAKGRACRFELVDGGAVSVAGGMMHDPSGRWWPARSVLCGPFKARVRRAEPDEYTGAARHYLGNSHAAHVGVIDTPPKALGEWEYVGEVERIYYTRTGRKRPGRYQHPFNKPTALATLLKGRGRVKLYRRGRYVRMDLPPGAILDTRGLVWP